MVVSFGSAIIDNAIRAIRSPCTRSANVARIQCPFARRSPTWYTPICRRSYLCHDSVEDSMGRQVQQTVRVLRDGPSRALGS